MTLVFVLLSALPAAADDSWWFSSQCPAQWTACAQEVLYAQNAHKALCYLIRYEGGEAVDIKGVTEQEARNANFKSEEDCLAKAQACHDWLMVVERHIAFGKITYNQQCQQ